MQISENEADVLLYAFDEFFGTEYDGKISPTPARESLLQVKLGSLENAQALRDRLFQNHEHLEADV